MDERHRRMWRAFVAHDSWIADRRAARLLNTRRTTGATYPELAAAEGISTSRVRQLLMRATKREARNLHTAGENIWIVVGKIREAE